MNQFPPGATSDLKTRVSSFLLDMPVARWYGLKVLAMERGKSTIELPFKENFTFDGRVIQAGVVGALADFAGATAAMTELPENFLVMTTGFEVHNTAPAVGESLVAVGEVIKPGKALAVSRADVFGVLNGVRSLCATALVMTRAVAVGEGNRKP